MPCKQKSFELVEERIFETFLHLPALDSVLKWHLEAQIVTCKYSLIFSLQFPLILKDWLKHFFISDFEKPFRLWLFPADECLPGMLLWSYDKTGSVSTFLALPAHVHQTKWLHFFLMQLLVFGCQNSLCKVIWRHFEIKGLNSFSLHGFYCRFHVYKEMLMIDLRFPLMVKFCCWDSSLVSYFLSCFGICGVNE